MNYNLLGDTGVLVYELYLGAMTFGGGETAGMWSHIGKLQQDEVKELLKHSIDAGINFIDTANVYSFGQSEQLLGEGVNQQGLSRYHIFQSVDSSLKRLQMDHIDLLYVHGVDEALPVEQIVQTLHDVVMSGKVRYVGVCNWPAWMVMKALGIAKQHGWHTFKAMQYFYAPANRDSERELIPLAQDQKLAFLPWSPLAGGFLSGKFTRDKTNTGGESRRDNFDFPIIDKEKAYDIIDVLVEVGKMHKVSAAEVALAWVRQQKGVTSTIIGAKKVEQLKSNIHSTSVHLLPEEISQINQASQHDLGYPNWMVERQMTGRFPETKKN
ncbi:MAG: aldo/keto reductase [Rufibacter sp.]